MGWHPDLVRGHSLSDFAAAMEGWQRANGAEAGPSLSDEDISELRRAAFGEGE